MHFTLITIVAVVAHTTQSLAAPLPVSYEVQNIVARTTAKEKVKAVVHNIAQHVPDRPLRTPINPSLGSIAQKAIILAKYPPQAGSTYNGGKARDFPHAHPPPTPPQKTAIEKQASKKHHKRDSGDAQELVARTTDQKNVRFKAAARKVIADRFLRTPINPSVGSIAQKAIILAKYPPQAGSTYNGGKARDFPHAHPPPTPPQKTAIEKQASKKHHKRDSGELQELVARTEPNSRVGDIAKHIPDVILNAPVPSNGISAVQAALKAAKHINGGGAGHRGRDRKFPHAHPPPTPPQKTAIQKQASKKHHRRDLDLEFEARDLEIDELD